MISARNRCPFTPSQWQELEHQALIFKYMVSGVPIPPELIYSVKRSLDSSLASRVFPHQAIGWGCFQVGFGRKADPEPGRCRRTDGKKWRCSKEAYPDSKYCERHMHRGRNRSRKPVEADSTTAICTLPPPTSSILSPSFSSINRNLSMSTSRNSSLSSISFSFSPLSSSPIAPEIYSHHNPNQTAHKNPFLYSHSPTSTRPPASGLSFQNETSPHHFLDSGTGISYSQADKDYRYVHGTREGVDERSFFPEASGSVRVVPDLYQPLTVSSYKSYPQSEYQGFDDSGSKQLQQEQDQQHCFVLGTDIKSARPIKFEKGDETQKPVHQFFGDWPPRNTDPWLDLASNSGGHSGNSISLTYTIYFHIVEVSIMDLCILDKKHLFWWDNSLALEIVARTALF
ncbi:growth-regulating factor 5-like [Durio zibethinus]|uniref:Growth-regulating factor n=1 Tax=Durio zibethinus TaxID=66656 RepID=A0A6P5WEP9_DURZI|nr:growth-regulating factor 5-like [Durio zibethinus]